MRPAAALLALSLLMLVAADEDAYTRHFSQAEELNQRGDLEGALEALRQAVTANPTRVEALVAAGTLMMQKRDNSAALEVLKKAAQLHLQDASLDRSARREGFGGATSAALHANIATILYQAGDPAGAALYCEESLKRQPDHPRCLYIHAVSALSSGRWAEDGGKQAIASLSTAIKLHTDKGKEGSPEEAATAYFALGSALMRAKGASEGRAAFEAALKLAPHSLQFALKAGEIYSRLGMHVKAESAFRAAALAHPQNAEAVIQTGNALRRQGNQDAAMATYKAALALSVSNDDDFAEAQYWIEGQQDAAMATYKAALALSVSSDDDFAGAQYWMGSVLDAQGKKSAASKAYEAAISKQPKHARSLNNLGSLRMSRNDARAEDLYLRAIASDPHMFEANNTLLGAAIASDPHMFEAYNNLGGHLLVLGRAEEALPLLKFGYQLDQSEPQLIFNLGLAHRKLGNYSDAVA
ncbi:hypothetical protein T484DRAFT_1914096 [Baffinella frigidus]|nr:hypothetical protein T484DRAFT_1914096 [Cryptophyta sp. CCMP2293]